MPGINFGTDGWRAVMAEDFTFGNVRVVTEAVARYLEDENRGAGELGVVLGYDTRFLSEQFASCVAEVLAGHGIAVYLPEEVQPTPVTAFAIRHLGVAGGIMITASHNPSQYNGLKFIPDYAGPAMPDVTSRIEGLILEVLRETEAGQGIRRLDLEEARRQGLVRDCQPREAYLSHLRELLKLEVFSSGAGLKVVIDPMYGAGSGYLEELLTSAGCRVGAIRNQRDPLYGGGVPEPMEKWLGPLQQAVLDSSAAVGLALDGDADRFGVVDRDGRYVSANQVLVLVLQHLLVQRGWQGPVARTVATTHLLDRLAGSFGYGVLEYPVGFKYIGQALRDRGVILGGEESGGLSICGHVPEKDGLLACALVARIVAESDSNLLDQAREISRNFGGLTSARFDVVVRVEDKPTILTKVRDYQPAKINGSPVVQRLTVDGVKLVLADGSWVLIRPSGTEPMFRIYAEGYSDSSLEALRTEVYRDLGL